MNYSLAVFASAGLLLLLAITWLALSGTRRRAQVAGNSPPERECVHVHRWSRIVVILVIVVIVLLLRRD